MQKLSSSLRALMRRKATESVILQARYSFFILNPEYEA